MRTIKLLVLIVVMHSMNLVGMSNPLSVDNSSDNNSSSSTIVLESVHHNVLPAAATVDIAEEEHDLTHTRAIEWLRQDIANHERNQKLILASGIFLGGIVVYMIIVLIEQRNTMRW